jgi:hypothetical protein
MKNLVIGALVAALMAAPASADSTADFRECFRWNAQENNFQGGNDWYNSEACKHWFMQAFGFTIPAILGMFILLLFPLIFYCARWWCNCCGGKHRTYGCCCADESSRHRFPGYANRSIFIAKLLMCIVFGAYIYYAVGGYDSNGKLHADIDASVDDVGYMVDDMTTVTNATAQYASILSAAAPAVMNSTVADDAKRMSTLFVSRANEIHHVLNNIKYWENNNAWGRKESVYRYPSCVLFCYALTTLFMFMNWRKLMGPMMVLVCLTSIMEGIVFVPHMVGAQGVTAMCDSYNHTVVPVIVGAIETQHGCNDNATMGNLNASAINLQNQFFYPNPAGAAPSALCVAMQTVCRNRRCVFNTCNGVGTNGTSIQFVRNETTPFNVYALTQVMTTPFAGDNATKQTIQSCAVTCQEPDVRAAAAQLAGFYNQTYPALQYLYLQAYPAMQNCSAVRAKLHGPLHDDLCTDVNRRATNVAMVTGVMYLLSFLSLPVIIRGMKRFVPMHRNQPLTEVIRDTVYQLDAQVNAVPGIIVDGGIDAPYQPINDDVATDPLRAADSAYYRRFYGTDKDQESQPLTNTAAPAYSGGK